MIYKHNVTQSIKLLLVLFLLTPYVFSQVIIKDSIAISPKVKKQLSQQTTQAIQEITVPPCAEVNVELISQSSANMRGIGAEIYINRKSVDSLDDWYGAGRHYSYNDRVLGLNFYLKVGYWAWALGRPAYVVGPSDAVSPKMPEIFRCTTCSPPPYEVRLDNGSIIKKEIRQLGEFEYEVHLDYADSGWTYNDPPGFWNGTWYKAWREYHAVLKVTILNVIVEPSSFHFQYDVLADTIQYGELSWSYIQHLIPVDASNNGISICPTDTIKFWYDHPELGNFYSYPGNEPVIGIPWRNAQYGQEFDANGIEPESTIVGTVSVFLADQPSNRGERTLAITPVVNHIVATTTSDTIMHGDTTILKIEHKDRRNKHVDVDFDTYLEYYYTTDTLGHLEVFWNNQPPQQNARLLTQKGRNEISLTPLTRDSIRLRRKNFKGGLIQREDRTNYTGNINERMLNKNGKSSATVSSPDEFLYGGFMNFGEARDGELRFIADGAVPNTPTTIKIVLGWWSDAWYDELYDTVTITIMENSKSILLGETNYYQAMPDPTNETKLIFKEMSETKDWIPGGQPAQFTVTAEAPTNKLGVYYEFKDNDGLALAGDMIRLIGRYWTQDQTYKVKLNAISGNRSGNVTVEVKKPARLLTPGQSPTYRLSRDVFNNEINIDEICIYYGGLYGVPPQFLKGQMHVETAQWDFGYTGFSPTYVFEPFTAQFLDWNQKKYKNGPWYIDPNRIAKPMGTGKDVPQHENVHYMQYPLSPKTLWDIIYDYSELVNTGTGKEHKQYGSRKSDGTMNFSAKYTEIRNKYAEFLTHAKMKALFSTKSAAELSREMMIKYLRDEWNGGAKNIVAQSRLASSYGLLQMLFSTAVWKLNYPSQDSQKSPEDFNETDVCMVHSLKFMKKSLQTGLTPSIEANGMWSEGFENAFKKFVWKNWNSAKSYPNDVYQRTKLFLPQN